MGLLLDTVNDALRPLPPSLVLRRSAAGDEDVPADDAPGGDPGALTVYRLQKEGGTPPAAPPHGPSAIGQGAPRGAAGADGVVQGENLRIDHPLIGLKDGLDRGEKITREAHVQEASPNRRSEPSAVSRPAPGAQSPAAGVPVSSSVATSGEVVVPVVVNAPAQRLDARIGGSREARGAPSEDLHAPVEAPGAAAAAPRVVPSAPREPEAGVPAAAAAPVTPTAGAPPRPPQDVARGAAAGTAGRPATPAPSVGGLHIGRIEVTVLAAPARPAPAAAPLAESQFLSRHYLRRT